jgi:type IV pilus assembly protein PilW
MKTRVDFDLQQGLTLVELLVALAISLVIVIAASTFFLGSSRSRDTQDAASLLQDNARFATEVITRSIQQAGYQNYIWSTAGAASRREVLPPSDGQPDLRGYNNTAAGTSTNHGAHDTSSNRINNSDTLVARFQGSSSASGADGSMVDCMGRPLPAPDVLVARYYSIFEVRKPTGSVEPELRCKYGSINSSGTLAFSAEPIVRGVESLQLMYGVDTNADSVADSWRNAEQVDNGCSGTGCITNWQQVRSVRVGMVLRSPTAVAVSSASGTSILSPLGVYFSQGLSAPDTLAVNNVDGRLRKVVTFTVNVRNTL